MNFSTDYPCMICGSLSPAQAAQAEATETLQELRLLAPPARRTSLEFKAQHAVVAAVLSLAIVTVGWFGLHSSAKRSANVATNITDVTAFPTSTTTPAQRTPLDKILVNPPHDFDQIAFAGEKNGPLGLADFDDVADRKMMQDDQFTGGYEHVWQRQGAPDIIMKAVFEFADEQHATDLFNKMTDGEQLLPGNDIPGAVIGTALCSCSTIGQGVLFRKDTRIFAISVGTTEGRFTRAESSALAVEQYKAS